MATLTVSAHGTRTIEPVWGALYGPPEEAYGNEGQQLDAGAARALASWAGPSAYLASLAGSGVPAGVRDWSLSVAGACALASFGTGLVGWLTGNPDVCYPATFAFALAAYGALARWLSRTRPHTGLLGFAERVRSCLAYEGDPKGTP
jgi:hypothetical protein